MATNMHTPGVYVRETPDSFLSVASGASAVPAFLYTAKPEDEPEVSEDGESPQPLADAEVAAEAPAPAKKGKGKSRQAVVLPVEADDVEPRQGSQVHRIANWITFTRVFADNAEDGFEFDPANRLHLAVRTYLDNGGGLFYTVSVDDAGSWQQEILAREDITLVVQAGVPAIETMIASVCDEQTRFGLLDVPEGPLEDLTEAVKKLPASNNAAAFYPWLTASWAGEYAVPPSAAVAGAICETDQLYGPWHAAANFDLRGGVTPQVHVSDTDQEQYMESRAVNMIRAFPGRNSVIWGVRTLQADSAEQRYIPVRRLMLNTQKDIRRALRPLIFEPNHQPTWQRAKTAIISYLREIWHLGGLLGATQDDAFYVKVGLDETMIEDDVLSGLMIIHVGLAITRPAEFIVLRFTQIMNAPSAV